MFSRFRGQIYIAAIIKQGKNGFFDRSHILFFKHPHPNKNNTITHEEHIKTSKQQEVDNVRPLGLLTYEHYLKQRQQSTTINNQQQPKITPNMKKKSWE